MGPYPKRHQPRPTTVTRTRLPGAEARRRDLQHANPLAAALTATKEAAVMIVTMEWARAVALLR